MVRSTLIGVSTLLSLAAAAHAQSFDDAQVRLDAKPKGHIRDAADTPADAGKPSLPAVGHHWESRKGESPEVQNFLNGLPELKRLALQGIDDQIAAVKKQRAAIAREASPRSDATGTRTQTGGSITRTDNSGDSARHLRLRECDKQVQMLFAEKKRVIADELWLPDQSPLAWTEGCIGTLAAARVIQVIDRHNLIAKCDGETFWLEGVDTAGIVDDHLITVGQQVMVTGTKQYNNVLGGTHTVFTVRPYNIRDHIIDVEYQLNPAGILNGRQ